MRHFYYNSEFPMQKKCLGAFRTLTAPARNAGGGRLRAGQADTKRLLKFAVISADCACKAARTVIYWNYESLSAKRTFAGVKHILSRASQTCGRSNAAGRMRTARGRTAPWRANGFGQCVERRQRSLSARCLSHLRRRSPRPPRRARRRGGSCALASRTWTRSPAAERTTARWPLKRTTCRPWPSMPAGTMSMCRCRICSKLCVLQV